MKSRNVGKLAAVAATTMAAAGIAVVGAAPAHAMYEDCYTYVMGGDTAFGSCWGRGAQWRLVADCKWSRDERSDWRWLSRQRTEVRAVCGGFGARGSWIEFRNVK